MWRFFKIVTPAALICLPTSIYIFSSKKNSRVFDADSTVSEDNLQITEDNYQGYDQDNKEIIKYIRTLLVEPSTLPYNLSHPEKYFNSTELSKYLAGLYGTEKRDGFYVEAGAADGERSSTTLYLERELGFKGLLIEPDPSNYKELTTKHRRVHVLRAALSNTMVSGGLWFRGSGQSSQVTFVKTRSYFQVRAFPLYSILRAVDATFVDLLVLDVQGLEFKVLKTIPFERVKFGVLVISFRRLQNHRTYVLDYMTDFGFVLIHESSYDSVFADPNYLRKLPGWKS